MIKWSLCFFIVFPPTRTFWCRWHKTELYLKLPSDECSKKKGKRKKEVHLTNSTIIMERCSPFGGMTMAPIFKQSVLLQQSVDATET